MSFRLEVHASRFSADGNGKIFSDGNGKMTVTLNITVTVKVEKR